MFRLPRPTFLTRKMKRKKGEGQGSCVQCSCADDVVCWLTGRGKCPKERATRGEVRWIRAYQEASQNLNSDQRRAGGSADLDQPLKGNQNSERALCHFPIHAAISSLGGFKYPRGISILSSPRCQGMNRAQFISSFSSSVSSPKGSSVQLLVEQIRRRRGRRATRPDALFLNW